MQTPKPVAKTATETGTIRGHQTVPTTGNTKMQLLVENTMVRICWENAPIIGATKPLAVTEGKPRLAPPLLAQRHHTRGAEKSGVPKVIPQRTNPP
jgi:hypothetical protein